MLSRVRISPLSRSLVPAALVAAALACAPAAQAATVISGAGGGTSGAVDSFRGLLGAQNPNVAGSFGSGRREINWDGVPDAFATPNFLPANFFNVNSPRGAVFSTPGPGFKVSANAGSFVDVRFGDIDPTYSSTFTTFSPQRLFTSLEVNIVDVNFFIPGSADAALVRGFGSVFSDVDLPNVTSLQFFGPGGVSLGQFFAPNVPGATGDLSFLGVDFGAPVVSRVRITSGNAGLAVNVNEFGPFDVVALDDFIYGEPVSSPPVIPEPETWSLMIAGFGLAGWALRRRRAWA